MVGLKPYFDLANQRFKPLSHLSSKAIHPPGFEPGTVSLEGCCSIQLS